MNGHDIRVKTLGRNARLAQEAASHIAARGEGRCEKLDRNRTFENHVAGEIDDSHAAVTDLAFEREAARQGGLQCDERRIGSSTHGATLRHQNSRRFISLKIPSASEPSNGSVLVRVASSVGSNKLRDGFFCCDALAAVFLSKAFSCESFISTPRLGAS